MWTILLASAALAAEPAATAPPDASAPATEGASDPALTGRWVLDEDDAALRARHGAAVQAALDQLPWALRPLARSPLEQIVQSCRALDLELDPDAFRVRCDARPPFDLSPRRARSTIQGERGETVEVRFDTTADGATLAFTGPEGGQQSSYRLQGDRLQVTTRLQGERLPEPVSWTARYRRQP